MLGVDTVGNPLWTCSVSYGDGSWTCSSDRNLKEDLVQVDGGAVLEILAEMPVYYWSPLGSETRHIGPMAQDFAASFAVGSSDTAISTTDLDGVALAAIQGLYEQNQALGAENIQLRQDNDAQQVQIDDLTTRLEALEQALTTGAGTAATDASSGPLRSTLLLGAGMLVAGAVVAWGARRRGGVR